MHTVEIVPTDPSALASRPAGPSVDRLRERVAQEPDRPGLRNRLAELLLAAGARDEAERVLAETVALFPRNPAAREALERLRAAQVAAAGAEDAAADDEAPVELAPDAVAPDRGAPDHGSPDHGAPDDGAPDDGASGEGAPDDGAPDGVAGQAAPEVAAAAPAASQVAWLLAEPVAAPLAAEGHGLAWHTARRPVHRYPLWILPLCGAGLAAGLILASRVQPVRPARPVAARAPVETMLSAAAIPAGAPVEVTRVVARAVPDVAVGVFGAGEEVPARPPVEAPAGTSLPAAPAGMSLPAAPAGAGLPAAAPVVVEILYPAAGREGQQAAAALAERLRAQAVQVAGMEAARQAVRPGVYYTYEEDRPMALAVATQLPAGEQAVRQSRAHKGQVVAPGTLRVAVR